MSYQVNGLLHEWPWTVLRMVFLSWQARDRLIALASIKSSSILLGVLAHGRPEIVYVKNLLDKRSAPTVISTFVVVYFEENLEHLRVFDASKMRAGVRSANKRVAFHVVSCSLLFDFPSLELVLGCSTGIEPLNRVSSADPKRASASACWFSTRGICWMVKVGNAFNNSRTLSRYKIILGCFAMYSP
ncbi:hypothetical protein L3X38_004282 [Prunus dulcis]|uniref:Uncharacterized protein n=1 Tax=Prunus dulcis TaxID=3755 RepID=A0AAD5F2Z5_PRUDU|nr:hypothetical protein L3X38_004282 [Prunus dulcis]